MEPQHNWRHVRGSNIVRDQGEVIRLKGLCLAERMNTARRTKS